LLVGGSQYAQSMPFWLQLLVAALEVGMPCGQSA